MKKTKQTIKGKCKHLWAILETEKPKKVNYVSIGKDIETIERQYEPARVFCQKCLEKRYL